MSGLRRIVTVSVVGCLLVLGLAATGSIEPAYSENAVGRFFGKIGNAITGKREKQTRQPVRPVDPARRGAHFDRETRKKIQTRLNELGHNVGTVDGIFGRGTQRGISEYQKSIGTTSTGILTKIQADRLLADDSSDSFVTAEGAIDSPGETDQPVADIAGPEALWSSLAMRACQSDELLSCMDRFGAPESAINFVKAISETNIETGPLVHFEDYGRVDIGEIAYPWNEGQSALILLNGRPPAVSSKTEKLPAVTIDGPTYRRLLERYGELGLVGQPKLESHRLAASGIQRFVFAYRLAKCDKCVTPGEVLVGFDFKADGQHQGVKLLGVWTRDPDRPWPAMLPPTVESLSNDTAVLKRRLAGLGFDAGDAESKKSGRVKLALTEFQKEHGTGGSGEVNGKTARLLAAPDIGIEISRFDQVYRAAKTPETLDFVLVNGISLHSRAERRTETGNIALARLNSRIARLYLRKKEPENALPYAQKAVSASEMADRQAEQIHGLYLVSLGETYVALDKRETAIVHFNSALDVFQRLTITGSRSRRDLAAKAFKRTGNKLIGLHEQMNNPVARDEVRKRLDAVEREMAAAQ